MSVPSTIRSLLGRLTSLAGFAGVLGGAASAVNALLRAGTVAAIPAWVWAAALLLALLALVGALALAVLRACWPSQSAHRMELFQTLLHRRSAP